MLTQRTVLDFAIFQLTPNRTRCELYAAAGDETEKLASGILKPFLYHMRAVKEQLAKGGRSIRLQPPLHPQHRSWFTKGTLQRFVRFVSNPDVLERVSAIEMELMQLEETVRMQTRDSSTVHAQGFLMNLSPSPSPRGRRKTMRTRDQKAIEIKEDSLGSDGDGIAGNSRKRLLYALEARRRVLRKEQGMSFARAAAAGFDNIHLTELILFSDCFGATRLREACIRFINLHRSKQEASLCTDGMESISCMQSDRPLKSWLRHKSSCKPHSSDDGGGLKVLEEGCDKLSSDLTDCFPGGRWNCTPGEDNKMCTCSLALAVGHSSNCTERERFAVSRMRKSDEHFKIYTCSPQKSPVGHTLEGHLSAREDHTEREKSAGTFTPFQWCGHRTQIRCCHEYPLAGTQVGEKMLTSLCAASCKDANRRMLPESKFLSSNLISKTIPGEPSHNLLSDAGKCDSCGKPHKKSDTQESESFEHKCLMSHDLIHNRKRDFVYDDFSPSWQRAVALAPMQEAYYHENLSDMVAVNNKIFTNYHMEDQSVMDDEQREMNGRCCKERDCGKDVKCEMSLESSQLRVRDVVSIFENRCHEEPLLKEECQRQQNHSSSNHQKVRKTIVERWIAGDGLIEGACHKDGIPETTNSDEKTDRSKGGAEGLNGMSPYVVGAREQTGLPCSIGASSVDDLKLLVNGSTYRDTKPGSWNPLYQEAVRTPRDKVLLMDCTTGNLSSGRSIIKERTNVLDLQVDGSSLKEDSAKTSCETKVTQTNGHVSPPHQRWNASVPSEERVKRFLDRYHEKRESRLISRSTAAKEEKNSTLKTMQAILNKQQAKPGRNPKLEQLIKSSKVQAEKLHTCKTTTPKNKDKDEEEWGQLKESKVCHQDRQSFGTKASTSATASCLQSPQSNKTHRSNSKISSPRLPAPRKPSSAGLSPGLPSDSCKAGTSKRVKNPLTSSVPSLNKSQGTTSVRASNGSQPTVDEKGVGLVRRPILQSKSKSNIMTSSNVVDKKKHEASKSFTRKVAPPAPNAKDQSMCIDTNCKDSSLPNSNSTRAKEGPKNFLRKGAGARSRVWGDVLQPKIANSKEVDERHKGAYLMGPLPPSKPQIVGIAPGQHLLEVPAECVSPQQVNDKAETPSPTYPVQNGSGLAAQQDSMEGLKVEGCARSSPSLNLALQRNPTLESESGLTITTLSHEEPRLLFPFKDMQPVCVRLVTTKESNHSGASHMQSNTTSEDALINAKEFSTRCAPTEPLITMQSSVLSYSCDPFETPAAQVQNFPEARSFIERSTHLVGSGITDVTGSKTEFQQLGIKWGTSRCISFIEPQTPTNSQGKDFRRLLKFGRRNVPAPGLDLSDQASPSSFSEEDEDRGSVSEPGTKIIDCYGRKRHISGKALNFRPSGNDTYHCSPSTPEHGESKSRKTIISLKRSVSTQEVHSKPQDRSKPSAIKATRAFFSLAPFRRKTIEGKS